MDEDSFRARVETALVHVRQILDNTKNPTYAADVPHRYDDKYQLAEIMTNCANACLFTCLVNCGYAETHIATIAKWSETRSVSLRFKSSERCSFIRKATRDMDSATKSVLQTNSGLSFSRKTVSTITEFFWQFTHCYELLAFRGTGGEDEDMLSVTVRSSTYELKTREDTPPRPACRFRDPSDIDVTWLFKLFRLAQQDDVDLPACTHFSIDRLSAGCHTPRRNPDVEGALQCFSSLSNWCSDVLTHFQTEIFPLQINSQKQLQKPLDLGCISAEGVFVPVVPFLLPAPPRGHDSDAAEANVTHSPQLWPDDVNTFLREEQLSLQRKFEQLRQSLPAAGDPNTLINCAHAELMVCLQHAVEVVKCHRGGVDYIEYMLRQELVAAIGKEVHPADFVAYMRFHNNKLFLSPYRPKPFCYAVRRSADHTPEGTLSIEERSTADVMPEPIYTHVSSCGRVGGVSTAEMHFPLNASTHVRFSGERCLHAFLMHKFQEGPRAIIKLRAEARQFSSFVVLIGRISSSTSFDPNYAMIVQNKDDISVPLDLETIPSAKEFKNAISSLSPEQQRFAKAFRSMQLESTLFGVLVIQIKPQLEKVLNLPPESLTKEIRLTQDLMELFVKYQIPPDLMSFSAESLPDASVQEKVQTVKTQVAGMLEMVGHSKEREIADRRLHTQYNSSDSDSSDNWSSDHSSVCEDDDDEGICEERERECAPPGGRRLTAPVQTRLQQHTTALSSTSCQVTFMLPFIQFDVVQQESSHGSLIDQPQSFPEESTDGLGLIDYIAIPKRLDSQFELLDSEGSVRPTIIRPGPLWTKKSLPALLARPEIAELGADEQSVARKQAYDLLDALTKSGAVPVSCASLHVVVATTHCFDSSVLDTVICQNINPIERVELSNMIIATTVHGRSPVELVKTEQYGKLVLLSPDTPLLNK